ncbi:hypothetical protein GCM10010320_63120 [Streptomyces caelestis]|nr:hypothetical protein GCM10010320_63120 [Streptomyces caelestis]
MASRQEGSRAASRPLVAAIGPTPERQRARPPCGKCLEIPGGSTADGATADQWTCHGGTHQLWRKTAATGGYVTFTNVNSGLCLPQPSQAPTQPSWPRRERKPALR